MKFFFMIFFPFTPEIASIERAKQSK